MRHSEAWLLRSANVGAKCILLIIAIVPLSDGQWSEIGAH